jgi:Uma2 family endonuclease
MPEAPRKYTAADIFFLLEAGLLDPEAKFELLDGAIIPMAAKGNEHEATRLKIARWLRGAWTDAFDSLQELTLTIDDGSVLEPDFVLFTAGSDFKANQLKGADVHLIIEVADTSLGYDLNEKAAKYAAYGPKEYWVVNARTGETRVHRDARDGVWAQQIDMASGSQLTPVCAPKATLKL